MERKPAPHAHAPDARLHHRPEPARTRELIKATGLTRAELAERTGWGMRTIERWVSKDGRIPFADQYLLEALVRAQQQGPADRPMRTIVDVLKASSLRAARQARPEPKAPARKPHPLAGKLRQKP